mgnify:CR=1 FL=1
MYKNIDKKEVMDLKELVSYQEGQVISRTLAQNEKVSVTLFSFDEKEEIGTHSAGGDALLTVLEGEARIIIDDDEYILKEGQTIVMPSGHPHSVHAITKFKMFLVVSF